MFCKRSLKIDPVQQEKLYQWISLKQQHSPDALKIIMAIPMG